MPNGPGTMIRYFFKLSASNSEFVRSEKFKMATLIRPELSMKNKYYIDKHRHYELKHFCLQYPNWKKQYAISKIPSLTAPSLDKLPSGNLHGDPTAAFVIKKTYYSDRIELIERVAKEADKHLYKYILKAVTENLSYTYLKTKLGIPCGKDMYYDRYRKFFWLLSNERN